MFVTTKVEGTGAKQAWGARLVKNPAVPTETSSVWMFMSDNNNNEQTLLTNLVILPAKLGITIQTRPVPAYPDAQALVRFWAEVLVKIVPCGKTKIMTSVSTIVMSIFAP